MCSYMKGRLHSKSSIKSRDSQTGLQYHLRHQFMYNMAESLSLSLPLFHL